MTEIEKKNNSKTEKISGTKQLWWHQSHFQQEFKNLSETFKLNQ